MTTLSVVIPAYNAEDGIEEIARRVLSVRESLTKVGVDELERRAAGREPSECLRVTPSAYAIVSVYVKL